MRLINADQLEQVLTVAINGMTAMATAIGAEEDEGVQMELKAYKDILDGVKGQETVKAIPEDCPLHGVMEKAAEQIEKDLLYGEK